MSDAASRPARPRRNPIGTLSRLLQARSGRSRPGEQGETRATAVLNLHREGLLLAPTLRSIAIAKQLAREEGGEVEVLAVIDRPDELTLSVLARFPGVVDRVERVDIGDLGAARAHGIAKASNDWVFLHDGDDLFSSNWYRAFFQQLRAGLIDPRAVYHTHVFARFGDLMDIRTTIDSEDPRFHPLFLVSEWYYSNKLVVNRKLFEEFPLPHNSPRTGIGNEDWNWASHTIHGGIRHSYIPETICFYRVKPARISLGLMPGMMQDASPLFDPQNILEMTRERGNRNPPLRGFSPLSAMKAEPIASEPPLPGWFWSEVKRQGELESLITEFNTMPVPERRLWLPNLNYNVVSATEYMMLGLDHRPKVFIFATMERMRAADMVVEELLEAARDLDGGAYQPVLIVDEGDHVFSEARLAATYGAKLISVRLLQEHYRLGEWYFRRMMMRPLMQFMQSVVIDTGSSIFGEVFGEFHRTILENQKQVMFLYPETGTDPLAPTLAALAENARLWRAHSGGPVPVRVHASALPLFTDETLWEPHLMDERTTAALASVTTQRFAGLVRDGAMDLAALLAGNPVQAGEGGPDTAAHPASRWFRVEAQRAGGLEIATLRAKEHELYLYRTADAWISPAWFAVAGKALIENAELEIFSPHITIGRSREGRYHCTMYDYSKADVAFATMYDQSLGGGRVPLVAMTRHPLDAAGLDSAGALARRLYRMVRKGAGISIVQDSVAIARYGDLLTAQDAADARL
ncbi:glycosyltransferase [Oceanicella sp. SM1341]|uniref:glycosyltransferase family 2 protein n=1 Tax=Oceanicella sp. SM1341 TaxID=1548889 RepID=UPI000E473DE1|nr:glycosyltransferase [Oceanicella sp. SM1341]